MSLENMIMYKLIRPFATGFGEIHCYYKIGLDEVIDGIFHFSFFEKSNSNIK